MTIKLDVILAIVFIVLQLTEVINWSWWWVLSPLWIPVALMAVIVVPTWFFKGSPW